MRLERTLLGLFGAALIIGCGSSDSTSEPAAQSPATSEGPSVVVADPSQPSPGGVHPPRHVVASFYDALRAGDNATIAALLTDRAREETARSGLGIQSQASSSLAYEIGETQFVTEGGAHVMSLWKEADQSGDQVITEVVWVLRKQPLGWRISGMATPVMEDQPPLLFNFEDPEDMLRKKAVVKAQMAESTDAASMAEPIVTEAAPAGDYPQVATPPSTPALR